MLRLPRALSAIAFQSRCPRHRKRESRRRVSGFDALRTRLRLARHTTADRMAAHRKLDRVRRCCDPFRAGARQAAFISLSLLRCVNFWLQNRAIQGNAVRTSLPLVSSQKHAAQRPEKVGSEIQCDPIAAVTHAILTAKRHDCRVRYDVADVIANAGSYTVM
jgi:hypothetical protein